MSVKQFLLASQIFSTEENETVSTSVDLIQKVQMLYKVKRMYLINTNKIFSKHYISVSGLPPWLYFKRSIFGDYNSLKKSLPLSSTIINAGKFSTFILRTASMPKSGKSITSTDFMLFFAKIAAGPPIEPR